MTATQPVPSAFAQALHELGLARDDEPLQGEPLAGGVSSDIWRIDTASGPVCAKRALPKLRVAADWRAPIERNHYEARWLEVANEAQPGSAPRVLGQHAGLGVLVMQWLSPADHRNWKLLLRDGQVDRATARAVGQTLGRIHAHAAARPSLAREFDTDRIFFDIRLEPYLLESARRHPDLASALEALVETTRTTKLSLVHGDVSPKNILVGLAGPVLVDAECAWWGDPAFDIAFCLNHLLLKCVWNPGATLRFLAAFDALARSYFECVDREPREELERRAARLLPGLLLARVDGKSPVEYLTDEADRDVVRRGARELLRHPMMRLTDVRAAWHDHLRRAATHRDPPYGRPPIVDASLEKHMTSSHIDPSAYAATETTRKGLAVTVRALRADDREKVARAVRGLDRESIYFRLFSYRNLLTETALDRIMHFDPQHEVVLLATIGAGADETVIASARYVVLTPKSAEVAFMVEEDYHGQGLASRLLRHLAKIARDHGIDTLEADVLAANKAMRAVFERTGWPMKTRREGNAVHVTLALPEQPA